MLSPTLASFVVGPVQFDSPWWLVLIPVLGLASWLIGRKSLAGLGRPTKVAALLARLIVIAALAGALAEPQLRRETDDVAVTVVLDVSRSIPPAEQALIDGYIADIREKADRHTDRLGVVTVARDAYVQSLPSHLAESIDRQQIGRTDATDLAAGLRLAVAVAPDDAATRVLLISDGNETSGSLLTAAEAARAAGVPVDVLPVQYEYPAEVIVEKVVAPANVRGGQTINLSVIATATKRTAGRLLVTEDGEAVDLDPTSDSMGVTVELDPGKNVLSVPIAPRLPGPRTYEAIFEPLDVRTSSGERVVGDSIPENNRASAVTFVGSEGWVLLVGDSEDEVGPIERALDDADLRVHRAVAGRVPDDLTAINAYECVVLVNQPAYSYSEAQQETLRRYIHDSGGGLVMIGGPDSFGAGGWIGSPLEDALPVQLDPPQKRQMPMGALAIVLDASGSMGCGVSGTGMDQQQVANEAAVAAVETLSRLDHIAVLSFSGGYRVVVPLMPCADQVQIARRIRSIGPGGGTNMFPAVEAAFRELEKSPAGVKHIIVLSDGQTMGSDSEGFDLALRVANAGGTLSTVAVGDGANDTLLDGMSKRGGGRFYKVNSNQALVQLPQIFMKEAQTVRRSLIWEGDPFSPQVVGVPTETMRGISSVPPISGYVVTAPREGLSQITIKAIQQVGDGSTETVEDPIAAQWQYGLGRVVAFTSDATSRWDAAWMPWAGYRQFWEQQVRWSMRPAGSPNVRVVTEQRGDDTVVIVEALDDRGERLNFANFEARVSKPGGEGADLQIRQVGPGRYEGAVPTTQPGAYVVSMQYTAPGHAGPDGSGEPLRGAVQAAITRPFADEFRELGTNTALLRQVAGITGGEVLSRDPTADMPWRREGLTMPVATRAIWLALAIASLGLFVADVGIRRVRIDPAGIARAVAGLFGRSAEKKAGEQIDSLRAARAKARARMAGEARAAVDAGEVAGRKFETQANGAAPVDDQAPLIALSGEHEAPKIAGLSKPEPEPAKPEEEEGGLSRLMKAKRRATEEFEDEGS
ncbi:MAG: VWA domain-containing protein [Phycisphaeraceae bacterium]|nr:MAG: VWA domain-containing protein [Phycisphaeraceae bacterium]